MLYDDYNWINDIYDDSQISDAYTKEAILNRNPKESSEADKIKRENILRGARNMSTQYPSAQEIAYTNELRKTNPELFAPQWEPPMSASDMNAAIAYRDENEGPLTKLIRYGTRIKNSFFPEEEVQERVGINPTGYTIYDYYPNAKMVGDIIDYGPRVKP